MSKDALLREMEAGFADLLSTVDGLSEEQMTRVWYGDWSVRDILAHVAGWHREEIAMLERMARGERPVPESADYTDDDAWNARFVAKWRAASAGEVLAELKATKEAYVAAASRLSEERFEETVRQDWLVELHTIFKEHLCVLYQIINTINTGPVAQVVRAHA